MDDPEFVLLTSAIAITVSISSKGWDWVLDKICKLVDFEGELRLKEVGHDWSLVLTKDANTRGQLLSLEEIFVGGILIIFSPWDPSMMALRNDWFTWEEVRVNIISLPLQLWSREDVEGIVKMVGASELVDVDEDCLLFDQMDFIRGTIKVRGGVGYFKPLLVYNCTRIFMVLVIPVVFQNDLTWDEKAYQARLKGRVVWENSRLELGGKRRMLMPPVIQRRMGL